MLPIIGNFFLLVNVRKVKRVLEMLKTLRACRKISGLTQKQLADMCGISQNAYSEIELGHYMPRLYVAMKISLALESPVNNFTKQIINRTF